MEIFSKLKKILFDEVTTEIPVITKESTKEEKENKNVQKRVPFDQSKANKREMDEEIIIEKIETPKREHKIELPDDEPFDMPKLKEEAKEEVKRSTFTFPVFDDDEKELTTSKRRERKEERRKEKAQEREEENFKKKKESTGYTNAYDYSYGKYKGDYKSSREKSHDVMTKTLEEKETHKTFTPSPIISPVYGVLNENYKKEDIVTKKEIKIDSSEPLDLDSVRRKAYGTLEEEIEISLSRENENLSPREEEVDFEDDKGISIDDLLVDKNELSTDEEDEFVEVPDDDAEPIMAYDEETELFEALENEDAEDDEEIAEDKEISIDETTEESTESTPEDDQTDTLEEEILEKSVVPISQLKADDETKIEKTKDKKETLGEEDLFDLIDSLYEGKGDE